MSRMFSSDQKSKLTRIVNEGIGLLDEIDSLTEGLNETIKAVAEEIGIKPSILKKAIKIAQKSKLTEANEAHDELTNILETVGRSL